MSKNKFQWGSPLLMGDNTTPGLQLPEEIKKIIPDIFKAVRDFGLDFYPTVVQMLTYDEISEVAAYGGFPVRFPHWKWGMEYNELQQGYEHGMHRIYEMVVNTNPCYIYCLDSNTLVYNVTVIAHALGHNDFFKNNTFFEKTSQNMMNELANHGTRVRKYMARWGKERVIEFLDHVLRIETLIDPANAWEHKEFTEPVIKDKREYKHPRRLQIKEGHEYMEPYVNPPEWRTEQLEDIRRDEVAKEIGILKEPTKDILRFIRDNAPLLPWQADIVDMIYQEEMYFSPQRPTKMANEGWASYIDFNIMARRGFVGLGQEWTNKDGNKIHGHDMGIVEYAKHKMGVLGGKYSMNPYKLGFCLFMDIEERWNKGQFGKEYDECTNLVEKANWDKKLGLGHEKVLEVRKYYNDFTMISEFFTAEFCDKYEFFEWEHHPNGEYVLVSRDHRKIRKALMMDYMNGGLPDIRLMDDNHLNRGNLFLQHQWGGLPLYGKYTRDVLLSLRKLWGGNREVALATKTIDGQEVVFHTHSSDMVELTARDDYEKAYLD